MPKEVEQLSTLTLKEMKLQRMQRLLEAKPDKKKEGDKDAEGQIGSAPSREGTVAP